MSSYSRSRRSRYSRSPSPYERESRSYSRSISPSRSRSRSRSGDSTEVENPGNNLYVTGLSPRITKRELEKYFSSEGGKVIDVHLVVDPRTRESRGFGFVTMSTVEEAQRCLKYLDRSVLEGRVITVEKAKRRRGRTPTPGRYLGLKSIHVRRRTPSYSPYGRGRSSSSGYSSERERDSANSPYYVRARYRSWSRSPDGMSPVHTRSNSPYYRRRDRSYLPCYRRRDHSYSPYYRGRERSYSPYYRGRDRSYSPYYRGRDHSYSPYYRGRDRSYSPYYRGRSPYSPYYRGRDRSYSSYRGGRKRSYSPYDNRHDRSVSPYDKRRSWAHSRSMSPRTRRRHYKRSPTPCRSYSSQSVSSVASSVPSRESRSVTPSS